MNRYSRQTKLSEINQRGQDQLLASSVLIIGVGGLGCPVAQYLAGAGVGKIGLLDGDTVDISNLHRQVLYSESDCGQPKASTAKGRLLQMNSTLEIHSYDEFLSAENANVLFPAYDLIVDCTDNIPSRLVINDACCALNKTWVYGGVTKFEGQVTVFNYKDGPSYRCLFPDHSPNQTSCEEEGVLGTVPGIIGVYMANEVLKVLLDIGGVLSGRVSVFNLLSQESYNYEVKRNPDNFRTQRENVIQEINPKELAKLIQETNDVILLDVRENDERTICKIDPSVHIPLAALPTSFSQISNKEIPIIAYCHHGIRSMSALQFLQSKGYTHLFNLTGGIDQWSLQVDQTQERY